VDGVGGSVKRMVYHDVMAGKKCRNPSDFVRLIQDRNKSIIIGELFLLKLKILKKHFIYYSTTLKLCQTFKRFTQ
jgi:hypothetical protein